MDDLVAIERFTGLYDRYRNRVYAYAVSRAGRQLADEVVSEVFLVAWRRLDELPGDPLPWLLVTARNVIGSEFRAAARQESLAAELLSWGSEVAPDIADEVSERQAVLRALAALPEADRELLTLSAWHGLSPRDAASVAGCSAATYFVRLHRARRRHRTWSDTTAPVASQPPAASLQELRESIATGDFTAARKTELNGQTVLELTAHYNDAGKESEQTVWVDPATPTPANMAELKATIPPGFTRTATIQNGP